ncbi:uncharacterized protein LOC131027391 [Cryptomeria japonica]|uniref:uncharacterized protein LOC131027391 n=1 Tax=Cryptomeria japonica TaxID=3369 RepID=UPI0025AB7074|nr:uncharacterized protein LOC131027391 [Cryptomeria japonica]
MGKNKGKLAAKENATSSEVNKKVHGSDNVKGNTEPGANEVSEKTDEPMAEIEAANLKTEEENTKDENEKIKKKVKSKKKKSKKNKSEKQGEKKPEISAGAKNQDKKKPEASTGAKNDIAGLIFMCNSKTKEDCFRYHVFGLPKSQKDIVERVTRGMKLFLYDFELRLMYGIYRAKRRGGLDLQPDAFKSSNRPFPAQVLFQIDRDCVPLPEDKFKVAIKDNYYGKSKRKFKFELNKQQVSKLCHLFRPIPRDGRLGMDSSSRAERRHVPYAENVPVPRLSIPVDEMPRRYAQFSEDPYSFNSYPRRSPFGGRPGPITSPQPLLWGNGISDLNYRGIDSQRELLRDQIRRERPVLDDTYLDMRQDLRREADYMDPYLRRDSLRSADTYPSFGGVTSAYRF